MSAVFIERGKARPWCQQLQRAEKLEIVTQKLLLLPAHAFVTAVIDVDVNYARRTVRRTHHQLIVVADDMRLVAGTPTIATALRR